MMQKKNPVQKGSIIKFHAHECISKMIPKGYHHKYALVDFKNAKGSIPGYSSTQHNVQCIEHRRNFF